MRQYWRQLLGADELGRLAADLAATALHPSTYRNYGTALRPYLQYCATYSVHPLHVTPLDAARYVAWLGLRGTVAAASLQQYLSAVNRYLGDHGREPVAQGALVASVRRGLEGAQQDTRPPPIRVALPADAVLGFWTLAARVMARSPTWSSPSDPDAHLLRCLLACVCAFLYFQRGEAAVTTRTADLIVHADGVLLYARAYKGSRGVPPVQHPVHTLPARYFRSLMTLLRRFDAQRAAVNGGNLPRFRWALTDSEPAHTWSAATLSCWLAHACAAIGLAPPDGFSWTSHSLRKGAATAAYAVGVPLLKIKYCGDWAQESSAIHRYIDVAATPTPAARQLFAFLVPGPQPAASGRPVA